MKLGNVQTMEGILGSISLDPFDALSEYFSSPSHKHFHIVVQLSDDSEYPCYLFVFSILLINAPHILLMFHSGSSPLPLCTVFLHCLYFVMFSALLIVDRWFTIIIPCSSLNGPFPCGLIPLFTWPTPFLWVLPFQPLENTLAHRQWRRTIV